MWNTPALGLNLSLPAISVRVSMRQRHVIFSVRFIYPSVSYTALKWRFVLPEGARFEAHHSMAPSGYDSPITFRSLA